jgi:hypothetical protein
MKTDGGVDIESQVFLTSALAGEWSASGPRGKSPQVPIRYEGGWAPRVSLDDVENRKFLMLPGLELPPLGRPARSQSLHWLRYPVSP